MALRTVVPDDFPPAYQGQKELDALAPYSEVAIYNTKAADSKELIERLRGAAALINVRAFTRFDEEVISALPDLKTIAIMGTGTDNVDLEAATRHGVVVTNTPGVSTASVAELNFALLLAAARHVALADAAARKGEWRHEEGVELEGKTIGLLGLGNIGRKVAAIAHGFGMKVVGWSMTTDEERARQAGVTLMEFDEVMKTADVVSLHLRASPQTAGIIGKRELALMKPTAILVNTARGALVDEAALADALAAGRPRAAGIDVFVREPLPADSPLLKLENVVLSPHVGWVTAEASQRSRKMPVDNLIAFFEGRPVNVVNRDVLKK